MAPEEVPVDHQQVHFSPLSTEHTKMERQQFGFITHVWSGSRVLSLKMVVKNKVLV